MKGRVDLCDLPLVTIDGETARDFDDAVFAEKSDAITVWSWRLRMSAIMSALTMRLMQMLKNAVPACISRAV